MKQRMLNWVQQFSIFCLLDNHQYQIAPHSEEFLLAAGMRRSISLPAGQALASLQAFINEKPAWLFGHLAYDVKNETASLHSSHPDHLQFPDVFFFEPEILIRVSGSQLEISAEDPAAVFAAISRTSQAFPAEAAQRLKIQNRMSKEAYIDIIRQLQQHIRRGDCYEINFCQEFYAENASINPLLLYERLSSLSPNPFAGLYKVHDKFLVCASPERFLKKQGNKILSQPIKGTIRRTRTDATTDDKLKQELFSSAKDKAENVMVVDLVRNDLAKICIEGTVRVEELYGIYSFPQVHQMISTVSGQLKNDASFENIIQATFPMGSMTGAPKKRVMELIEQYEKTRRSIFSGALGYINPEGDFDFNVVIRSIMYNAGRRYLSFQA
ncbi:MAG TPA: anthranilate synthase component I family protein, partial [Chitinophagaceae bacterium]|nr:anthranilate synthase component I family protein [Chitinophagaceae bacterium]